MNWPVDAWVDHFRLAFGIVHLMGRFSHPIDMHRYSYVVSCGILSNMMSSVGGMTVDKLVDASYYADFESQFLSGHGLVGVGVL